MSVCCECCVFSGRGLCDELMTNPEESYRMWCVVVCDLETSWMRKLWPIGGLLSQNKKKLLNPSTYHRIYPSIHPFSHLPISINPLNYELNPICHLLAFLGTHRILHVSRIRVKYLSAQFHPSTPLSNPYHKTLLCKFHPLALSERRCLMSILKLSTNVILCIPNV